MSENLKKLLAGLLDLDKDGQLTIKDLLMLIGMLQGLVDSKQQEQIMKGIANEEKK